MHYDLKDHCSFCQMDLNLIIEGVIGLSNPHVSQSERGRYLEV